MQVGGGGRFQAKQKRAEKTLSAPAWTRQSKSTRTDKQSITKPLSTRGRRID